MVDGTFAVQLVWVILPEVEMVWVKIFPSSGIHGPQMLSVVCQKQEVFRLLMSNYKMFYHEELNFK